MPQNINQKQIREALVEALPGAITRKVSGDFPSGDARIDLVLHVKFHALDFRLLIEVMDQHSFSSVHMRDKAHKAMAYASKVDGAVPMIMAPYISSRRQEFLRDLGVAYMDLSGNVFIRHKSIHVDRRGFGNRFREKRSVGDPFSDRASLALRVLIESRRSWGLRELAQKAGLSPGYASKVVRRLEELGYVSRSQEGIKLHDARSLLDDWVADYKKRPKARERVQKYFCRAKSPLEIMSRMAMLGEPPSETKYAMSLQAGAHLVEPYASFEVVDVCVDGEKMQSFFIEGLGMRSVEKGENVRLKNPYYKESAFFGARKLEGLWVVSDLQLYLDLYDYPIRGREQAERVYARRLKKKVER